MRYLMLLLGLLLAPTFAKPAPGELPAVDEPAVCLECHGEMKATFEASHVHTAFAAGECSGCHNPHASRHAGLLATDGRSLCRRCHDDMPPAGLVVPHPPVANGDCVHCHDPHASAHVGQLRQPLVDNCSGCHAAVAGWSDRSLVHAPVDDGECLTCHASHGSDVEGMLLVAVPGMCFECHDAGADFAQAHGGRAVTDADCTACHDPHASDQPNLLRAHQHDPFAADDCGKCHDALESGGGFAIAASPQDMCLQCHRSVGNFRNAANRHNLDDEASCLNCHTPHASNATDLLRRDEATLCMGCHFNDKEDKSAWVTHDGMSCGECHVAHGNDDSVLLRTRDTMLCGRCHESAHQVSHPMGDDVIDPRTGESVNCLSCHQLHGARFELYLPLSPNMELCIQCHSR